MVRDIWLGICSSSPANATGTAGRFFFNAHEPGPSRELWKSDGTAAGTQMVKDINPGDGLNEAVELHLINGMLYFRANDGVHGRELWKSDGTQLGTHMVKDFDPGPGHGLPSQMTEFNGAIYLAARESSTGVELWRTDGTAAGTTLVKDIYPGSMNSNVGFMKVMNDMLFFWANDGEHGYEVWRSDGTEAGTVMVKDIAPSGTVVDPGEIHVVGDVAYFAASDADHGSELWRTDGTEAGTWMVKDINPGSASSNPFEIGVMGDRIVFFATTVTEGLEIWTSDGTEEGTHIVSDMTPGVYDSMIMTKAVVNGVYYFTGYAGQFGAFGYELFACDGDAVWMVKDINPGTGASFVAELTPACGGVIFRADDGMHGGELWYSNGTEVGTYMLADILPGADSGWPSELADLNEAFFVSATVPEFGREPWVCSCAFATVGVDDLVEPSGLRIAPVPARGPVSIALPEADAAWDLTFTDLRGRAVYSISRANGAVNLDVGGWTHGVYQVVARTKDREVKGRLVVQ